MKTSSIYLQKSSAVSSNDALLESVHVGESLTGTMDKVKDKIDIEVTWNKNNKDPTQTLPESPPPICKDTCNNCLDCKKLNSWWSRFRSTVDDLILRSNVHNCRTPSTNEKTKGKSRPTCINKQGKCKARFPII